MNKKWEQLCYNAESRKSDKFTGLQKDNDKDEKNDQLL